MPVSARRSVVLPWSMWPAVPTTTRHRERAPPSRAVDGARARSSSSRGRPSADRARPRPSSIRAMTAGSPVRRAAQRAAPRDAARATRSADRRQRLAGQRAAADRRRELDHRRRRRGRRDRAGQRRRAPEAVEPARRSSARPGSRSRATPARYSPSVAASAASVTLSGRIGPRQRVAPHPGDEVGPADDQSRPAARRPACRR